MQNVCVKKRKRRRLPHHAVAAGLAVLLLFLLLSARHDEAALPQKADPGEPVQVHDGANDVWITPAKGVAVSPLRPENFSEDSNGWPVYRGRDFIALRGIDISEYQSDIDWTQVRRAGIDFVIIRCGYRGYEKGTLCPDSAFAAHAAGAYEAGLQVGAYFFSQAVTPEEAAEEADYTLTLIRDCHVNLPVMIDWERVSADTARTNAVDITDLTDIAQAFCETIEKGGYDAGIYFNRQLGYYAYDWSRLQDYAMWVADYNAWPDFYYTPDFWQYSAGSQVPGISIQTDMNLWLLPR